MKLRSVDGLKGGEVLAEPIVSEKNDTIVPRGTVIKTEYIPLILSMGIQTVMVEDSDEKEEAAEPAPIKTRFDYYVSRIKKIMEGHIYHSNSSLREFEMIANEMIKDVQEIPQDAIVEVAGRRPDLYEHTIMVALLSLLIGKKYHLERKQLYDIALGCLLHDIGMRYVTVTCESVDLNSLEPGAIFEYKKHTILGYSALDGESWIADISKKMILSHHERIDGTGYPMRQKNKELECRIIQVTDAFDSMISGMGCEGKSVSAACYLLREMSKTGLDSQVVEKLLSIVVDTE